MRRLLIIIVLFLTACKNQIDANSIELRKHGLSYIKGTNKMVDGEVVRKADGKTIELQTYKDGKMIGPFFQYGAHGQVLSQGFGTEIKSYERLLNGTDLTNCILSIVQVKDDFSYATLYMDNTKLFNDYEKLIKLSKNIIADYSNKYKLDGLLIFDDNHEYSISKSATINRNYIVDTISRSQPLKINLH